MRAVGFLLGALLVPTVTRRLGLGPTLAAGAFLMGLGVLVILLADGPSTVLLALLVVGNLLNGLGNPLMNVNASSLRQAVTPDHLLGRMQAGYRFIGRGGLPIGALASGILGATVGIRETLAVGLVGFLLAPLWLYLSPVVRMRTAPAAATPDERTIEGDIDSDNPAQ